MIPINALVQRRVIPMILSVNSVIYLPKKDYHNPIREFRLSAEKVWLFNAHSYAL
jgi:hypothetical protein